MSNTVTQGAEFLAAVYTGVLVGAFYELCRLLRRACRGNPIISAVVDAGFWLVTGGGVFLCTYLINGARPRWHLYLGILLGMALHFYSFGIIIRKIRAVLRHRLSARGGSAHDAEEKA